MPNPIVTACRSIGERHSEGITLTEQDFVGNVVEI
jgi:hypothetical protein